MIANELPHNKACNVVARRNSNADMYRLGESHRDCEPVSETVHDSRAMSPLISVTARYNGVYRSDDIGDTLGMSKVSDGRNDADHGATNGPEKNRLSRF